jgi:hypothetical protein
MIRLRFVTCDDQISALIRWAEDFWASHVEAVVPEGYLGAHADGGVAIRPVGYDQAILAREEFVDLPAGPSVTAHFEKYLRGHIGEPYDFDAIFGFVLRDDMHAKAHAICSALQTDALIECGIAKDLPLPSYQISPRDLRLYLAGVTPSPSLRAA